MSPVILSEGTPQTATWSMASADAVVVLLLLLLLLVVVVEDMVLSCTPLRASKRLDSTLPISSARKPPLKAPQATRRARLPATSECVYSADDDDDVVDDVVDVSELHLE